MTLKSTQNDGRSSPVSILKIRLGSVMKKFEQAVVMHQVTALARYDIESSVATDQAAYHGLVEHGLRNRFDSKDSVHTRNVFPVPTHAQHSIHSQAVVQEDTFDVCAAEAFLTNRFES